MKLSGIDYARLIVALSISVILFSVAIPYAAGQAGTQSGSLSGSRDASSEGPQVDFEMRMANIYETNINHDDEGLASRGSVPGLGVTFRNRKRKPTVALEYRISMHNYTNTDRWDRISNYVAARLTPRLSKRLYSKTEAEMSLKGSSEDRDLSDQYQIQQTFEYRIVDGLRIHFYGTARIKRYEDPDDNSFKPNGGVIAEVRLPGRRKFEADVRYEINDEINPRGNYTRRTLEFEYERPGFFRGSEIELKAKRRLKDYERTVEIEIDGDDVEVGRSDVKTSLGFEFDIPLIRDFGLVLEYEYEWRTSNDSDKYYNAHAFGLSFVTEI